MDRLKLSVIIPTARQAQDLEDCLNSLSKQDFSDFEVVVVTQDVSALSFLKDKFKNLNLVFVQEKEKKGLSQARNLGLSGASAQVVSFIDDDVVVSSGWVSQILDTFGESGDIGGVSGPTLIPRELLSNRDILAFHGKAQKNLFWKMIAGVYVYLVLENQPYSVGKIFKSGGFSLGSNYEESAKIDGNREVDYLEACNMSFRKAVLDKTGGFSPEYKGVGDWSEPDLAFRVRRENYRLIFNPKVIVNHCVSGKRVYGEKGGDCYQRTKNFIHFYFQWIKPDSIEKILRFSFNLFFINLYWVYKFFQTRNGNWLLGISGTFSGLREEICR